MHHVHCFLWFANFYWIFINNYSQIIALLTWLTLLPYLLVKSEVEEAFQTLKITSITTLILTHPYFFKPFYMEIDASNFALKTILLLMEVDGWLHPFTFYSKKFSHAEINYKIHDKEFLFIEDLLQWRVAP